MIKFFKNLGSIITAILAWIVLSTLFWGWLFNLVTDTTPKHKVTIFIEGEAVEDDALALALEEDMPEGIKMVKVHPFSFAFFDSNTLLSADVYIVKKSNIEQYRDSFAPLGGKLSSGEYGEVLEIDSEVLGIKVYDAASGEGILSDYVTYPGEDCYLFVGSSSAHLEDGISYIYAERLLNFK